MATADFHSYLAKLQTHAWFSKQVWRQVTSLQTPTDHGNPSAKYHSLT